MLKFNKIVFSLFTISVITILIVGTVPSSVFAESLSIIESFDDSSDKFVPGQIVVGLKNTDPYFNAKVNARGGQVINTIESLNAFVIKVPVHAEEKFISSISKNPNIQYAERDAVVNTLYTPNDPLFNIQWGMQRIGMESVWEDDPNLGAGIIVAVVDTGIYYDHPDFTGTNILEELGHDFVDGDDDTRPTATCLVPGFGKTVESHSTFVSGIIAATKDNSLGVSGVAPVDILPIRVLGTCGSGSSSDVADGIRYAADYGADVINLSLGSSVATQIELDAVNYAHTAGAVIVAAAGNDGDGDNLPSYPASYDNVISVSAIARDDSFAPYSQHVLSNELAAPGGTSGSCTTTDATYIASTGVLRQGNSVDLTYTCGTGTSFAAPHVSGVAALIKASHPGITNVEIRLHLQNTALDLGDPGRDDSFGYGLVMADAAVSTPFGGSPPPDITAPTISTAATSSTTSIDLGMSETVSNDSATPDDFTVFGVASSPLVTSITVSENTITLNLNNEMSDGDTLITVSYTQSVGTIDDTATPSNSLANFVNRAVTNNLDTTPPIPPFISSPNNGDTITTATPTISGNSEANASIEVFDGGVSVATTTTGGSGDWSVTTSSLSNDDHALTAYTTDAAGNTSAVSNTVNITVDVTVTTDTVTISKAEYKVKPHRLTIVAESTNPSAELTAYNHNTDDFLGSIVDGKLNLKIGSSPIEVRVESNLGGSATQIVQPS